MKSTNAIRWISGLFHFNAVIWLAMGIWTISRTTAAGPPSPVLGWIIAAMVLGNAGAMLLSGYGISRRIKWAVYFAFLVIVANIVLTFTDQFGIWDLITLLIDVTILGLLAAKRNILTDVTGAANVNPNA
ncbi:MAG: hypothetical protein MUE67_04420 [Anaerolineales bacterium]|nr:hypothetical protein [Anaerolineales bacterium]